MRVLALDDMETRQRVFQRWFAGFDLVQVYTAKEAIEALNGPRFDLAHLDHDLEAAHYDIVAHPTMHGYQTVWGTGMDVVDHILAMPRDLAPVRVIVHSWNMGRAFEMVQRLNEGGRWARHQKFDPNRPTIVITEKR